jgi:hypothetical protein
MHCAPNRVSFETSFDLKQPELETKLVLALSVFFGLFRNSLFRLFRFYTETESFDLSIEPKQTGDPNSLKESIFGYFQKI